MEGKPPCVEVNGPCVEVNGPMLRRQWALCRRQWVSFYLESMAIGKRVYLMQKS